jgi:DNA processing protein
MAVPGPINATYSVGCNCLIRDSKAALVTSAEDIMNILGWQDMQKVDKARKQGIERSLFVELDDTERILAEALAKNGDRQPNDLAIITGLPISSIISTLFTLEMKGVVALRAGNVYHLIG